MRFHIGFHIGIHTGITLVSQWHQTGTQLIRLRYLTTDEPQGSEMHRSSSNSSNGWRGSGERRPPGHHRVVPQRGRSRRAVVVTAVVGVLLQVTGPAPKPVQCSIRTVLPTLGLPTGPPSSLPHSRGQSESVHKSTAAYMTDPSCLQTQATGLHTPNWSCYVAAES